jgi:hypothetical protein
MLSWQQGTQRSLLHLGMYCMLTMHNHACTSSSHQACSLRVHTPPRQAAWSFNLWG